MPALKKGLSGLEPYEGKLSRTVLRGGSGGNITLLPGAQALISRFDKLWTEDCVQWRTDARDVRIIWGLLSGRRRNKPVVYHAVNQLL
jgi:hypothetical protein